MVKNGNLQYTLYGMIITLNEGKSTLSLLKRIFQYRRCTRMKSRLDDLALMAHYWDIIEIFVQANSKEIEA